MWRQQCTLIKHAKINQSQSLLELFKLFDRLTKRQQSITNWTSAKLSASSSLERLSREEGCLQRVQSSLFSYFKYGSKGRWKLIHSPEDSSCIVALENVNFSSGNYEARSSWSKLADENTKCRVELERGYSYLQLVTVCCKIARTSVHV